MGTTFGRQVLDQVGQSIQVAADAHPWFKPGGITIDWTTIAVAAADTYLQDGFFCPAGEKYVRYGQVVTRITGAAQIQTITVTGTPTGGTFTLNGVRYDAGVGVIDNALPGGVPYSTPAGVTIVVPYNATAAVAQPLFDTAFGAGNTTVGGGPLPATPLTVTFNGLWGNGTPVMTVTANALTGGAAPAATVAITTPGNVSGGLWGPYDPAATDGRATMTMGDCFILNTAWREIDIHSNHVPALRGGLLWQARVLMTTGPASLAAGPTVANVQTYIPDVQWAKF